MATRGAVGDAQFTDRASNVERRAGPGDDVTGDRPCRLPVDRAAPAPRVAAPEHDVLGDAEVVHEPEVLVNETHVETVGVAR